MASIYENNQMHVVRVGKGTPMILLHGILSSHHYWADLVKHIPVNKYEVIMPDLIGFGDSKKPYTLNYSIDSHAGALERALLENINKPAILAGHSMGAMIALQLALRNPNAIKELVLINPPIFVNTRQAKKTVRGAIPKLHRLYTYPSGIIIYFLRDNLLKKTIADTISYPKSSNSKILADDNFKHSWRSFSGSLKKVVFNYKMLDRLCYIGIRTKIIIGKQDPYLISENIESLDQLEKVSVIKINGSHHLPIEKSIRVSKILGS